jgi:hypothetical protein
MDALQIAGIGEFPGETNRGGEALFHVADQIASGHARSPMIRVG